MTAYQTPPCMGCGQTTTWTDHSPADVAARKRCAPCNRTFLRPQAAAAVLTRNAEIDGLSVEFILAGYRRKSTRAGRTEAARILLNRNFTHVRVAARLGVSTRTVERYRAALLRTVAADCQQDRRDEWRRINGLTP